MAPLSLRSSGDSAALHSVLWSSFVFTRGFAGSAFASSFPLANPDLQELDFEEPSSEDEVRPPELSEDRWGRVAIRQLQCMGLCPIFVHSCLTQSYAQNSGNHAQKHLWFWTAECLHGWNKKRRYVGPARLFTASVLKFDLVIFPHRLHN